MTTGEIKDVISAYFNNKPIEKSIVGLNLFEPLDPNNKKDTLDYWNFDDYDYRVIEEDPESKEASTKSKRNEPTDEELHAQLEKTLKRKRLYKEVEDKIINEWKMRTELSELNAGSFIHEFQTLIEKYKLEMNVGYDGTVGFVKEGEYQVDFYDVYDFDVKNPKDFLPYSSDNNFLPQDIRDKVKKAKDRIRKETK